MGLIIILLLLLFFISAYLSVKNRAIKNILLTDLILSTICIITVVVTGRKQNSILLGCMLILWIWLYNTLNWLSPKLGNLLDSFMCYLTKTPKSLDTRFNDDETPEYTISKKMCYNSIKIVLIILFLMSLL